MVLLWLLVTWTGGHADSQHVYPSLKTDLQSSPMTADGVLDKKRLQHGLAAGPPRYGDVHSRGYREAVSPATPKGTHLTNPIWNPPWLQ